MDDATIARLEVSVKSAHHRLDEFNDQIRDFRAACLALERMDEKVDTLRHGMEELRADVKELSARPAHHWDRLIAAGIGAAVSAAVSAVVGIL